MKRGVQEAIRIASLPQHQFDARMNSGEFSKSQIVAARALRGDLLGKRHVDRLMSPAFTPVHKREEHRGESPMLRTIEKKIEDSIRMQSILKTAIREVNKGNICWYTNNADRVLFSAEAAETHRARGARE
jgi:hypothetical protein